MKRLFQNSAKPATAQASIRQSVLKFYRERDVAQTKDFCMKLLEAEDHKKDKKFRAEVHGEICEALLEVLLTDYIKKNRLENRWFFEKGMVLRDLNTQNKEFYTELDLTLFTPGKIVLFECKSYAGDKTLDDECTIVRKCGEFDVFKQNKNHMIVLDTNVKSCCLGDSKRGYRLALFNFSLGSLKDLRDPQWRAAMPVIDTNNINAFLDSISAKPAIWDVSKLKKVSSIIMEKNSVLRKRHLEYVKKLKH